MSAPTVTLSGFVRKSQLASQIGVSCRTINNLMTRRVIPFYRVGGLVLFRLSEVEQALARYRVKEVTS